MRHAVTSKLAATGLILAFSADAADWPRWRGPDGNGISRETGWSARALEGEPKIAWRANVGTGFSSFAVADGRVLTSGNRNNEDTLHCFAAATGKELWRVSHPEPLDPHNYDGGPSATPTVEGGTVYQLSRKGWLLAADAATGAVRWQTNAAAATGAAVPQWGFSGSPFLNGDLLVVNVGRHGSAFDKRDGRLVWTTGTNAAGYTTPVPFELRGRKGLAIFGAKELAAVTPATGEVQWTHPWEALYDINASDPVFHGASVFITSGPGQGGALLDLSADAPRQVWLNRNMDAQFAPPVLINGYLYGISGASGKSAENGLACVELATGKLMWKELSVKFGAVSAAGDKLIVIGETGELVVAEVNPERFAAVARAHVLGGRCWTVPVLSHGRIYVRNSRGDVACVDVKP
ncbi:MAG: PQQ-binding-like beta-propeller repeat protein [Limisphaerales bacterium]